MAMGNWPPRVALITGAASGLGRQLALLLASDGVAIAALDLHADGLQTLEQELQAKGFKVVWECADVTDAAALKRAVDALEAKLGPIDLLIAAAGIGYETPVLLLDPEAFNAIIHVNLIGVSNTIAAVLPGMLTRRRGQLVAISSLSSYRGLPYMAAYCASKSGLNALMEAVRVEVKPRGIATTIVCPGWVRTPMTAKLRLPISNMLEAEDAARQILAAVRKGKAFTAFPAGLTWQVRLLRWLPTSVSDWMIERMLRKMRR